jgi:hypothetical protein
VINAGRDNQQIVFTHGYTFGMFFLMTACIELMTALPFKDKADFQEVMRVAEGRKIVVVFPYGNSFV